MSRCVWDEAWIGRCKEDAILPFEGPLDAPALCAKHSGRQCASCGKTAVKSCEQTGIQFVCGAPLCATCHHGIVMPGADPGMFLLGGGHVTSEKYMQQMAEYDRLEDESFRKA